MKVILTTLSNTLYENSRLRLGKSAERFGINNIISYDFEQIKKTPFFKDNEEILSHPKTMGYWLWKPYIIFEAMKMASDNDIVIYCDAGVEIIRDLNPLIEICTNETDILLFANSNFTNKIWTKRDCFVLMDCDEEKYWNGIHADAAFCIFKKTERSIQFIEEWLHFGTQINIITDLPNISGKNNFPEFMGHRMDQSILSLLAIKYQLNLYRMPTQFGNHYKLPEYRVVKEFNCLNQGNQSQLDFYSSAPFENSRYYQLLNHHRKKNETSSEPTVILQNKNNGAQNGNKLKLFIKGLLKKRTKKEDKDSEVAKNSFEKKSYSQCGEDVIVHYVFNLRGIGKPSYLDIGAHHPFFLSNTAIFYERGCSGVNIEANPQLINEFITHRPNDINLNIGISDLEGELDFYIMQDNTLSTFSKEECDFMIVNGKALSEIKKIKLTTISNVLEKYFNNTFPDFMTIDAEGMDYQILQSIDFEKSFPKVICVEAAEYSPIGAGKRRNELIDFLVSKGYYEYANTNLNAIMVKNEFWFI